MVQLSITLLGSFQVTLNGEVVTHFGSDTARALLIYLVMHPGITHRRDVLAGLLWPEQPNDEALRNLRVTLSRLRDAIGDREASTPFLDVTNRSIQFNDDANCFIDAHAMQKALTATKTHTHAKIETCGVCAQQLHTVADLYRGELLPGFALDSVPFEEWLVVERENLHWQALEALYALTNYYFMQMNYVAAIEYAHRQVELEIWREIAYRQWMRALALSGHRGEALMQYDTCRKVLSTELGVEPEPATVTLYEQIRDGVLATTHEIIPDQTVKISQVELKGSPFIAGLSEESSVLLPQPSKPQMPESTRRFITIVQAELCGGTALLARSDTEDYTVIINQLLRAISAEIHRFGGEIDRVNESGLVAAFGAQTAHEDDPERGVLAAMAMLEAFYAQLIQLSHKEGDWRDSQTELSKIDLDLRIIVHTGEVIVTILEEGVGVGHRSLMGDAVSSSTQMLTHIVPGEVRVSETTYRLVAPEFDWKPKNDIEEQGYRPITRILSADKDLRIPGMMSALVGRESELHNMYSVVKKLQSGIGGIITLVGEAGIGKSRLVTECRGGIDSTIHWIEGRCVSYGLTIAYQLWVDVLRSLLHTTINTPLPIVAHLLRQQVHALDPEFLNETYACLGRLLSIPLEDKAESLVTHMDAENLRKATFRAFELLLAYNAQRQPLVIVCEDLHWADSISLHLLDYLLNMTDRVPLLFICVFRPQPDHDSWRIRETALRSYPHRHIDIQLTPLSTTDGKQLLENLLLSLPGPNGRQPVERLPDDLKLQILNRGEGNPFFVEEILRALIDKEAIVCDKVTCQWQMGWKVEDIGIPETLYGVLRARIDQLPVGARHVLQLASVIGQTFPYPILANIADQHTLDEHLVTLQREEMIYERVRLPEVVYSFKHQLTRETVYDGLLHSVRRTLHQRVAESMERLYPDRIDSLLGLLAHHWEQARNTERALSYLRRAKN